MAQNFYEHAVIDMNIHVRADSRTVAGANEFPEVQTPFVSLRLLVDGVGVCLMAPNAAMLDDLLTKAGKALAPVLAAEQARATILAVERERATEAAFAEAVAVPA